MWKVPARKIPALMDIFIAAFERLLKVKNRKLLWCWLQESTQKSLSTSIWGWQTQWINLSFGVNMTEISTQRLKNSFFHFIYVTFTMGCIINGKHTCISIAIAFLVYWPLKVLYQSYHSPIHTYWLMADEPQPPQWKLVNYRFMLLAITCYLDSWKLGFVMFCHVILN